MPHVLINIILNNTAGVLVENLSIQNELFHWVDVPRQEVVHERRCRVMSFIHISYEAMVRFLLTISPHYSHPMQCRMEQLRGASGPPFYVPWFML